MVQSANSPFSLQMCRLKVSLADSVESAILQIGFPPFDPGNQAGMAVFNKEAGIFLKTRQEMLHLLQKVAQWATNRS